jgi:acetyl esterase/lipase
LKALLGLSAPARASIELLTIPPYDDTVDDHQVLIRIFRPNSTNAGELVAAKSTSYHLMTDLAKMLPSDHIKLGLRPAILFAHGGGFCVCGNGSHDGILHRLAQLYNTIVVAVEYRKAPEHTWPDAPEDVHAALRYIAGPEGFKLGISSRAIFVSGDSAGGNLAAVATLWARDGDVDQFGRSLSNTSPLKHPLLGQILLYPTTNCLSAMGGAGVDTGSVAAHGSNTAWLPGGGKFLTAETRRVFTDAYLSGIKPDFPAKPHMKVHPFHSPLHAGSHENLPPALLVLAEVDVLRDDGLQYADKLLKAGVYTRVLDVAGTQHGFLNARILFEQETEQVLHTFGDFMRTSLWSAFSKKATTPLHGSSIIPSHKSCDSVCALHCSSSSPGQSKKAEDHERSAAAGGMVPKEIREQMLAPVASLSVDESGVLDPAVDIEPSEQWPGDAYYVEDTTEAQLIAREYAKQARENPVENE